MRKVDLFVTENFSSADQDEERWQPAKRWLKNGADERMSDELVGGVHLGNGLVLRDPKERRKQIK